MDPEQWLEPKRFLPERFDPENPMYYLTPRRKSRSPFAFIPFLAGKRICIGKTFVEMSAKLLLSVIYAHFDFEPVD